MSIKRSANRFRNTYIDGWDGAAWNEKVARCALSPATRALAGNPSSYRVRSLLLNPLEPLLEQYKVIRVTGTSDIYLVGNVFSDYREAVFSNILLVRQATYICELFKSEFKTAMSGFKSTEVKVSQGVFYCDKEASPSLAPSSGIPGAKLFHTSLIFPAGVQVMAADEVRIASNLYTVEAVHEEGGLTHCYCLTHQENS